MAKAGTTAVSSDAEESLTRARELLARGRIVDAQNTCRNILDNEPHNAAALNLMGHVAMQAGEDEAAVHLFHQAVKAEQNNSEYNLDLGLLLLEAFGDNRSALGFLKTAHELDPANPRAVSYYKHALRGLVSAWHFRMMNDAPRNKVYRDAISKHVEPGMTVLEIGTGSGLLSLMAAEAGAETVITCEAVPEIAAKAQEIVAANGYEDKVSVVNKFSTDLTVGGDLPKKADLLLSEVLSCDLVGERVMESVPDAVERLVEPDATVIPRGGKVMAALVDSPVIANWVQVDKVEGFDLSPYNEFAPHSFTVPNGLDLLDGRPLLSGETEVFDLDFREFAAPVEKEVTFTARTDGTAIGLIQWIRVDVDGNLVYENHPVPNYDPCSWEPVFYTFPKPVRVKKGDTLPVIAAYHDNACFFNFHRIG